MKGYVIEVLCSKTGDKSGVGYSFDETEAHAMAAAEARAISRHGQSECLSVRVVYKSMTPTN